MIGNRRNEYPRNRRESNRALPSRRRTCTILALGVNETFPPRYVFLLKPSGARLYQYLSNDSRFALRIENNSAAVFEIM